MKRKTSKKSTGRSPRPKPAPAAGATETTQANKEFDVALSFRSGDEVRRTVFRLSDRTLYPETKRWTYVLRNRDRLTDASRKETPSVDLDRLAGLFVPVSNPNAGRDDIEKLLKDIAAAGVVEVVLPWLNDKEETGYAARLFPWEMVLTFLTRQYRQPGQSLTVVRQLDVANAGTPPEAPESLLAVSNAPGKIAELFNLIGECRLVANVLGLPACAGGNVIEENPEAAVLEARIQSGKPGVIHLTGVDPMWALSQASTHRGAVSSVSSLSSFFALVTATEGVRDGLVLSGPNGTYAFAFPERLAQIATAGGHSPQLVAVSACYSGRRVGPRLVAAGVHAAIGFQDTVTDAAAETFFSAFYRLWREEGWPHPGTILGQALVEAMPAPTASLNLAGGVVIWSRHSVFAPPIGRRKKPTAIRTLKAEKLNARTDLEVIFKPVTTLNYSLLHNRRSLFKELYVRKQREGILPPLTVQIQLDVGAPTQPCIFSCDVPKEAGPLYLTSRVSTPLVAPLLRRVSESLRSNLYLKVTCDNETVCETTEQITILPVDEWRDDGKDHCWLPSFVLPRDPAILRIITAALRYLRAIADDPQAGFSGYQGIGADGSDAAAVVDPQVRAVWAALQHEFRLAYINPPPSYTLLAQRLRSPSQILAGGAATCIDLALLFAGCLEYIGVLPAIFLIQGHAFPGYWREETSWDGLKDILKEADEAIAAGSTASDPVAAASSAEEKLGAKWMLSGIEHFPALTGYVRTQSLVPFESTFVTANRSFAEALVQGRDNLHPRTFDSMIDVGRARANDVTPLPIIEI